MKRCRLLVLAILILLLLRPALSAYTFIETKSETAFDDIRIIKVIKTPLAEGEADSIVLAGHRIASSGVKDKAFLYIHDVSDLSMPTNSLTNWDLEGRGYQFTDTEVVDLTGDGVKEIVVAANFNFNTTDPTNITSQVLILNRELNVVKQVNWTYEEQQTYVTSLHIGEIEILSDTLEVVVGGHYLPAAADETRPYIKVFTQDLDLFDGDVPEITWNVNASVTDIEVKNLWEEAIGTKEIIVATTNGQTSVLRLLRREFSSWDLDVATLTNPSWTDIRSVIAVDIIDNGHASSTPEGFRETILGIQDQNYLITDISGYKGTSNPLSPVTDIVPLSLSHFGDMVATPLSSDQLELIAGGAKTGEGAKAVLLDKELNELATYTWAGGRVASLAIGSEGDLIAAVLGMNNLTVSILRYPEAPNITITDLPDSLTADQDIDIDVSAGDPYALLSAVLEHNATGEFQNITKDLSGQNGLVDITFTIEQSDLKANSLISVRAWAINKGGRWNVTDNSTFEALGLNGTINVTIRPIEPTVDQSIEVIADYHSKHTVKCSARLLYENSTEHYYVENMLGGNQKSGKVSYYLMTLGTGNITAKVNCSSDYDSVTNTTVFVRDLEPPTFDLAVSDNLTVNATSIADAYLPVERCAVTINGSAPLPSMLEGNASVDSPNASMSWTMSLPPGNQTIKVCCRDTLENEGCANTTALIEVPEVSATPTPVPNATVTPNATVVPNATISPNATVVPNATATPTTKPNATVTPSASTTPKPTAKPSASPTSGPSVAPTPDPNPSASPGVSATPEPTKKPSGDVNETMVEEIEYKLSEAKSRIGKVEDEDGRLEIQKMINECEDQYYEGEYEKALATVNKVIARQNDFIVANTIKPATEELSTLQKVIRFSVVFVLLGSILGVVGYVTYMREAGTANAFQAKLAQTAGGQAGAAPKPGMQQQPGMQQGMQGRPQAGYYQRGYQQQQYGQNYPQQQQQQGMGQQQQQQGMGPQQQQQGMGPQQQQQGTGQQQMRRYPQQ